MRKLVGLALGLCLVLVVHGSANANEKLPILDMHMHARLASHYGPPPQVICAPVSHMPYWDPATPLHSVLETAPCENPLRSPTTDREVLSQTIAMMERHNIFGVLGGTPELVTTWMAAAPGRFIPGLDFRLDRATGTASPGQETETFEPIGLESLEQLFRSGAVAVFAEVLNQFGGIAPDDDRMDSYWALAEAYDIPVGIHIGPGAPGEFYLGNRAYRARLQSALTLEEVLVRYPRLRVYIMHAGYPFLDDLIALLFSHPQVYVEVSMLANVEPRAGFYRYLKGIVDAGYGKRVMFGSDQMVWPGLIEAAIQSIGEAPFLTPEQKRDIFYNNAARFLRLSPEEIARHHAAPADAPAGLRSAALAQQADQADQADFVVFLDRLDAVIQRFANGDADAFKDVWAHSDDVTVAGGFGGEIVQGWSVLSPRLSGVADTYANTFFDTRRISTGATGDFGYVIQHEYFRREEEGEPYRRYRVTMLFRREAGEWRLFHRHADAQLNFRAPD